MSPYAACAGSFRPLLVLGLVLSLAVVGLADSLPEIEARYTEKTPKVDGVLEEIWNDAAQVARFIQCQPCCGQPASESTRAYLMYDRNNLYVAFRCAVKDITTLHARLSETADAVHVFLDTFDDDASCYVFSVRASGSENDYRMTDDGQWTEEWDGVWRSAVKRYAWGYAVEMAIPFKSLRYDVTKARWGIDFSRGIIATNERSFWSSYDKKGFRVSRMGELTDIRPGAPGLHLELYPVGVFRVEQDATTRLRPSAGLDLSWLPTPTTNLQLTTFPDFAQIEADPYQVNLTRYELWLEERRPFFMEAQETFGTGYQPLQLFYSRRIGEALPDNKVVPIWAGGAFTGRFGRYTAGALGAMTGRTEYDNCGIADTEPMCYYSVFSLRRAVLANSEFGLLYAGKDNEHFANHGLGIDGMFRFDPFTAKLFAAGSQYGDSLGYGLALSAAYQGQRYSAFLDAQRVDSLFDVNGTGYTGWRGQRLSLNTGPVWINTRALQRGDLLFNAGFERGWVEPGYSKWLGVSGDVQFRNRSAAGAWGTCTRKQEQDSLFWSCNLGGYVSTDYSKPLHFYASMDYTSLDYNYRRGQFAPNASSYLEINARVGDHLSLGLSTKPVFEFRPYGRLYPAEDITIALTPSVTVTFTPKMEVTARGEVVFGYDVEHRSPYRSYRPGLLYSWTFRPRSTLYVAFDQQSDNSAGPLGQVSRVGVVKLRYLFVF